MKQARSALSFRKTIDEHLPRLIIKEIVVEATGVELFRVC
jgi:hypothetical protein